MRIYGIGESCLPWWDTFEIKTKFDWFSKRFLLLVFFFSLFVCLLACILFFLFSTLKSFVNINRSGLSSVRQECSLTRFELKTCLERDPCFFFFSLRNAISVRRKFGWFYSRWIINFAFIHILTVVFFISSPPQLLIPNGIFNYSNLSFTTTTLSFVFFLFFLISFSFLPIVSRTLFFGDSGFQTKSVFVRKSGKRFSHVSELASYKGKTSLTVI